ncbi:hypothetical protein BD780_004033 [Clostridium tetanomorphum]|uniref:hypothetical protein n=1 Tax=Clostridium tetanomorphum TaxID=1553 RepID=UPI000451424B|nr:hypothetical protein [Clostridium tetanomorphum]KAJ53280.1 hypothetical protein CTM_03279 [Clostridium tetanomorphum DSM 665]MBP1865688.1 hypothetical protein [Clostridium tetanomorphum]NRS86808.1 hypothetical protein [Clostridium tetanomorphum]SQC00395.1 Uncharacterised protein [Clostridium tetanomorphum]
MIFESNITFALKNECGKYIIKNTLFFKMKELDKEVTSINSIKIAKGEIIINIRCPVCCGNHCYRYSLKELACKELLVGGCEEIGIPILYIGKYNKVRKKIFNYDNINKEIYAMI